MSRYRREPCRGTARALGFLAVALVLAGCGGSGGGADPVTLLAAGDIAECGLDGDEATAELLGRYPDATIATLGDNAYQDGTDEDFAECYDPSWGRYRDRTKPATGNHDHNTTDAAGYHRYFEEAGGPFDEYWYSYDLGAWHVAVLNTDCWRVGGCEPGSPQVEWLEEDLEEHPARCTLAYLHRPPFSSGRYGDGKSPEYARPLWEVLYERGADLVLTGHEHSYERFAPMNATGEREEEGMRLFVVGTGGGNLRAYEQPPLPATEVRNGDTWGVLKLLLYPDRYEWEFLPVEGKTFTDSGSGACR